MSCYCGVSVIGNALLMHSDIIKREMDKFDEENEICPICLEKLADYASGNKCCSLPIQLSCGHFFHTICFYQIFKIKQECPCCRRIYVMKRLHPAEKDLPVVPENFTLTIKRLCGQSIEIEATKDMDVSQLRDIVEKWIHRYNSRPFRLLSHGRILEDGEKLYEYPGINTAIIAVGERM